MLTTHYMDEAQSLADRVAVINAGVIVAEGTPDTIGGRAQAAARIRFHLPPGVTVGELPVTARSRPTARSSSTPTTPSARCTRSPAGRWSAASPWRG